VKLDRSIHTPDTIAHLAPVLKSHAGNLRVYLQVDTDRSRRVLLQLGKELSVRPSVKLVEEVESLLGNGAVQLRGDGSRRLKRIEQQKLFVEDTAGTEGTAAVSGEEPAMPEMDAQTAEDM
jgi:hypothetical protein